VTVATPQLSLAKAGMIPRFTPVAVHPLLVGATTSAGQEIRGATVSSTSTVNVQSALLPLRSVAVYCTVVEPTGKVLPGWCAT
jgi:hypothetical protein